MIRRAVVGDFDAVTRLLTELGRAAPTPENRGRLLGVWENHLARPETSSMLALVGNDVVGFCSLEFRERLNYPTPEAWIPDLIVTESQRGRNVGRALLEAAMDEASRRGAHRLILDSEHHRTRAHEFYLHAGMTDSGHFFTVDLR